MIANLLIWSMHVAVLIGIGILASQCFAWRLPQSRLRFYQLLLLLSLLLPIVEPWRAVTYVPVAPTSFVAVVKSDVVQPSESLVDWERVAGFVLIAGVLVRLSLLGFGVAKLGALRRCGEPVHVEGIVGIQIRQVDGLKGPAAFGWLNPVILLPSNFDEGVVYTDALGHELEHVLRNDWIENMMERIVASLLWFHPMSWWLMERIHLTREEAVDLAVAGSGTDRERYLQSLLSAAGLANSVAMPAASFVRRPSHLVERIALLSKETTMSIRTTAASAVMTILVTGATLTLAGFYFPLQLTAQEAADLQVRWKRPSLHASGLVQVEATLSADGQVIDARVLSGPDELRKEALQAVLFSRFAKGLAPRVITVSIEFTKGTSTAVPPPPPPPPPPVSEAEFEGTDYVGLSPEIQQRAMEVMAGLRSGQHLTSIEIGDFNAKLMQLDASLRLTSRMSSTGAGPVMLRLIVMKQNAVAQSPAVIRVGPNVQEANLINRVDPEYPPLAKQARIQGVVRFAILVGKDGGVERVTVQNGHPLLIPSAMEAVRQYKFRPTLLNGQPITVATTVEVNFVL